MVNFGSIRFLLLASALTLALPVAHAHAEDGLPEVEIDGSVLSDIARMQSDRNLPPVQLVPPPMDGGGEALEPAPASLTSLEESKISFEPTSLTSLEDEVIEEIPAAEESDVVAVEESKPYTPVFLSAPEPEVGPEVEQEIAAIPEPEIVQEPLSSQPVFAIREKPARAPEPEMEAEPVRQVMTAPEPEPLPEQKAEPVVAFGAPQEITGIVAEPPPLRPALAAGTKAGMVSSPLDMPPPAATPKSAPRVVASVPVAVTPVMPATAQLQAYVPPASPPPAKPEKKMRALATFEVPLATVRNAPVPPQAEIMPPKVMGMNEEIKAPDSSPVVFPVMQKSRTESFDPSTPKTAVAPALAASAPAPVILAPVMAAAPAPVVPAPVLPKKKPAVITQPALEPAPAVEKTASATPETSSVPVPKPRPAVQTASEDFVRKARENLVETYTKAVPEEKESGSDVARAKRLSVADIESDPLASQLVDMSPEDVAVALNNMAPAVGQAMAPEAESRSISKPRIVRVLGERLVRQSVKNKAVAAAAAAEEAAMAKTEAEEPKAKVEQVSMTTPAASLPVKEIERPGEKAKSEEASNLYAIAFKPGQTDVPEGNNAADLVQALQSNADLRVQIVAFASTDDGKEGTARRTSLSRALAVRSWLVSKGIDATRMDVRALGLQGAGDSPDRVEMILMNPKKG